MGQEPAKLTAIYPGTFDPITNGHLDLIIRASGFVNRLIVGILRNESKHPLFSLEERTEMMREVVAPYRNVEVDSFDGLLVEFAVARGASLIVRGIRAISDYEYELQMALMNRRLRPGIETVFMMASEAHSFVSSRMVKEVIKLGGNISGLVPPGVEQRLNSGSSPCTHDKIKEGHSFEYSNTGTSRTELPDQRIFDDEGGRGAADRLRRQGVDVVDFGAGEPDFPTPENIKRAGIQAITDNFTKYTPASGTMELKEAICERHATDYGTSYKPNECVVTVGGKHVIFNLMQVLVNPGDEVIIPVPYWVTYKDVVTYAGGKCVFVDTDEQAGFTLTASMIEPYLNDRTKLIIINSPSNPSGGVLSRAEFEKIYQLTSQRGIWLMTDECYCRFLYEGEPFSIAAMPGAKETVIVAGSLSKTYSMTGWRIGFGLAPVSVIAAIGRLQSHMTSNPTSIAQKAAVEALRGPQDSVGVMLAEYRIRRDYVISRLRAMPGVVVQEPKGAFYAYPNIGVAFGKGGIHSAMDFAEKLLEQAQVAVVPGEAFGTDRHVRISYATSMEELKRGLDRIENFLKELN